MRAAAQQSQDQGHLNAKSKRREGRLKARPAALPHTPARDKRFEKESSNVERSNNDCLGGAGPRRGRVRNLPADAQAVKSVVLVHGGFVDGSGWEGVYQRLRKDGYDVTIVQNPTSLLLTTWP